MTISFLVVSRDMKSTHFFSSSYVCERSTIFWNMVLFLARYEDRNCLFSIMCFYSIDIRERGKLGNKQVERVNERLCWLEIKSQVSGDDGDVHEMNHVLYLSPVKVLVDVQWLQVRWERWASVIVSDWRMWLGGDFSNVQVILQFTSSFSPRQPRGTFQTLDGAVPRWRSHAAWPEGCQTCWRK